MVYVSGNTPQVGDEVEVPAGRRGECRKHHTCVTEGTEGLVRLEAHPRGGHSGEPLLFTLKCPEMNCPAYVRFLYEGDD